MTDDRVAALAVYALTEPPVPASRVAGEAVYVLAETLSTSTTRVDALPVMVLASTRPVAGTDVGNRVGGRTRSGEGIAVWNPPVVPSPNEPLLEEARDVAHAFGPVTVGGTQPTYNVNAGSVRRHADRIVVGGRDVTYYRGAPTPFPGFTLAEPLLYGPTTITFPQISAAFEQPGVGVLKWCRLGAPVHIDRVDRDTGEVASIDYRGVILGYDAEGASLTLQVGGEAEGRAAVMNRQVPIFSARNDIGRYVYRAIKELGLRFDPRLGPETGILQHRFGGQGHLDYIRELIARSWTRDGNQWTVMPDEVDRKYRMFRKDTTTIHGVVYADDSRTVAALSRDVSEEPNRIFSTGVTPEGQRVRFGAYPGLKQTDPPDYPMAGNAPFGEGTTNAETVNGDGITVMIGRLVVVKYLDLEDMPGGYDSRTTRAIKELQGDADLPKTGIMNLATWRALYDLSATGFSLRWSRILPAAEKSKVRRWKRSASGAIMGRNPNYDPTALKVDRNVDMGTGFTREQIREWSKAELEASNEENWVGTITFGTGALLVGDFDTSGDPPVVAPTDVLRARDLRPGMNLHLPLFDGGTTVHVAAIGVSPDGVVSATVDTRARDAMPVWEIITRNRESRKSPAREWLRDHRSSTETKDSIDVWDEVGGVLGDEVPIPANTWVVFPVVAGQEGEVRSLRVRTNPNAEYVMAIFGQRIWPARLRKLIGNPLTKIGTKQWSRESIRDRLDDKNVLLYVAGDYENPLGYYPKIKEGEGDEGDSSTGDFDPAEAPPLTGRWEDDAGFSYHTFKQPVLWVAIYADRDTSIPAGRLMWNQLESGV